LENCGKLFEREDYNYSIFPGEILEIPVIFDFRLYNKCDEIKKTEMQLKALEEAISSAIKSGFLEFEPILRICNELKGKPFENNWVWKRKKISKDYTAFIIMEHTLKSMNIYAEFKNKMNDTVYRKLLLKEKPSPICYDLHLGKLELDGKNGIVLHNKMGTKSYKAQLPEKL